MESVLVATSIAAVTELLKRLQDKDWRGTAIIVVAALIGALAGLTGIDGLTVADGIIYGLGIAGVHTIARQVG